MADGWPPVVFPRYVACAAAMISVTVDCVRKASMSTESNSFDAFLSYSRVADAATAHALRHSLQSFAKPWYRRRALRVFRDDASLSANPALWRSIEAALDSSTYLILLACPEAAASPWVAKEITHWLATASPDRILLVVTDGEVAWDDAAGDFNWSRTTAVPHALRGAYSAEPRWVDLRWTRAAIDLSRRHPRFRQAVADIAAPIHGKDKDDLVGDDVRLHRRAIHMAWGAAAILLVLALVSSALTVVTVRQRDEARAELVRAKARDVASQANTERAGQLARSLLLSLESLAIAETPEGWSALVAGLAQGGSITAILREHTPRDPNDVNASYQVGITADGATVAAITGREVSFWDRRQHRETGRIDVGVDIHDMVLSPDGNIMVIASRTGPVHLWDVAQRRRTATIDLPEGGAPADVALSPDGTTVAVAYQDRVGLWDIATSRITVHWPLESNAASALSFSPDSRMLAVAHRGVHVYDVVNQRRLTRLTTSSDDGGIADVAFSPDGTVLAAGSWSGSTFLWTLASPAVPRVLTGRNGSVSALAFSADGTRLFVGGEDQTIASWYLKTEDRLSAQRFGRHQDSVTDLAIADSALVSISSSGEVLLWDPNRPSLVARPTARHDALVGDVAFSPDGRLLASSGWDDTVRLWDVATGAETASLPTDAGQEVEFGGDSTSVVVLGLPEQPVALDIAKRTTRSMDRVVNTFGSGFGISPDGSRIAFPSNEGKLVLWDLATGRTAGEPVDVGQQTCSDAEFDPSGAILAIACDDGLVLWDIKAGRAAQPPLTDLGGLTTVTFSPDGRWLAALGRTREIGLWNIATEVPVRTRLGGHTGDGLSLAFSPDSMTLASGDDTGALTLWDLASLRPVGTFITRQNKVFGLDYSPDGKALASAGHDGSVLLWDMDKASWRRVACQIAHRNLTEQEWAIFIGADRRYRESCP